MENETQTTTNWLQQENNELESNRPTINQKESLFFEENKITEFKVDFSQPFDMWIDPTDETVRKKIIPVINDEKEKNLWLNVKNPLYAQIIRKGTQEVTDFKVLQIGTGKNTRYQLVE